MVRFGTTRVMAACAVTALALMAAVPAAHAQEQDGVGLDTSSGDTAASDTLLDRLIELGDAGAASPEQVSAALALPLEGESSLNFDEAERLEMMVLFEGPPSELTLERVRQLAEVQRVQTVIPAATVNIDPSRLAELLQLPGVLSATPSIAPITGAVREGGSSQLRSELQHQLQQPRFAASRPDGTVCGPIDIEADAPLRADQARAAFGVDGTGVRIGIISDSYDVAVGPVTTAVDDVASGALPGAGNPCDRTAPVEVLREASSGVDEGRAMAQLVHGIAPGATLLFAAAGNNEAEMAQSINDLADAGADIIVDDISMLGELTYQQGIISVIINQVRARGVAYFTSAGNATGVGTRGTSIDLPVGAWQTTAYRPTNCPSWVVTGPTDPLSGTTFDCLDFDPNTSDAVHAPYETFTIKGAIGGGSNDLMALGSVGEPLAGVTTDYEWRFFEVDDVTGDVQLLATLPRFSPMHPNFGGQVTVQDGSEVRMVMVRKSYDPAAPLPAVRTMFLRGGDEIAERVHLGDNVTDWVGETTLGHAADGSAVSVASLHWDAPTTVREYSSLGPGTLLFEPISLTALQPAARLGAWQRVDTPHLAAVDGTVTTFFGDDQGAPGAPEYRFYGTSAAAPNAAAVAALALSYARDLDQATLTQLMMSTAAGGVVNPYPTRFDDVNVFGAGRVDALALLSALPARPAAPSLTLANATANGLRMSWVEDLAASGYLITLFEGAPDPANAVEASQLLAGTTSYDFTGLKADTAYTVVLTPSAQYGVVGATAQRSVRTLAAGGGGTGGGGSGGGTSGKNASNGSLRDTGSRDYLPVLLGAGAVVLLGGAVLAVSLRRRTRADKLSG